VSGRATQGVRVINLREGDAIASVTAVPKTDEEEIVAEGAVVETTAAETTPQQENANE
jgi:DNA gyrase subunit A